MWIRLKIFLSIFFILFLSWKAESQSLVYSFIDPCTKIVTNFNIPIQGGTTIFFLGQQRAFTANDFSSGVLGTWINQVYSDYRKISPCSVQSTTVIRNQITSQIIGSTVSSVVGSIMGQAQSIASGNLVNDDGGKDNSGKKQKKNETNNSNNSSSTSNGGNTGNTTNGGTNQQSSTSNNGSSQGTNTENSNSNTGNGGAVGGGNGSNSTTTSSQSQGNSQQKGGDVVGSTIMNVDSRQENGSSKGGGKSGGRNNPIIVSSDLTSAQNLDKSFTGIINIGMSQSSLTETSSWGVTSMIWFNLKQFAISGRYSKIQFSKNGKLKLIHNLNLTGVYSYGNYLGFLGYSAILNAGKWGVTGLNISAAATKIPEDGNLFVSPSVTAFYTKPFKANTRLIISPEIYIISTPLIYSSVDKVSVTDRTFSAFLGSGFDYQLSKRFKFNFNYKLNMSTNPDFPILSFFLIGSKVNL